MQRDPDGVPAVTGENGSVGPLGAPTSDENAVGDLLVTTFEHGKIEYDPKTDQVKVTVNGKVVLRALTDRAGLPEIGYAAWRKSLGHLASRTGGTDWR